MRPTKSGTARIQAAECSDVERLSREAGPAGRGAESAAGHRLTCLRSSVVLGAVAIALIAAAPARAAKIENLNKLGKESYFAFVEKAVRREVPAEDHARRRSASCSSKTGEGTDDLVLVIARTTDRKDRVWLKVRLPIRPNGTTGWVQESALSELQPVDTWIKVSTKTYKITVIKKGKRVFSASVGVGQPQWPTPKGQFYIRAKLTNFGDAVLRAARLRHQRDVGHADRLAGRRHRRHPRHESPGLDPGPDLARLRAHEERGHPEARQARRGRHPDHHHLTP